MRVFLSWSGAGSRELAAFLRDWLPDVIQSIDPFMSEEDIAKGAAWFSTISSAIAETDFCVISLTHRNQTSQWVMFEAGAVTNQLTRENVSAILVDLKPAEVTGPLGQFQHVTPTKEDLRRLLDTLNNLEGDHKLEEARLDRTFEANWPRLEQKLEEAKTMATVGDLEDVGSDDVLAEVLAVSRATAAVLSDLSRRLPRPPDPKGILQLLERDALRKELGPVVAVGTSSTELDPEVIKALSRLRTLPATEAENDD